MTRRKPAHPSAELVKEHMAREARIFGPTRPHAPRGAGPPPRCHRPRPLLFGAAEKGGKS